MAKRFEEILKSPSVTFVIGQEKSHIIVNSAIVAGQSQALNAFISDHIKEASTSTVVLEDVDCGTFAKFCQFAYFGDYDPAIPNEAAVITKTVGNRAVGVETVRTKTDGTKTSRSQASGTKRKTSGGNGERRYVPFIHIEDDTPPPSACMAPKPTRHTTLGALLAGKKVPCRRTTQYKIVHEPRRPIQHVDPKEVLLKEFKKKTYITLVPQEPFLVRSEPYAKFLERKDYKVILLEHARLYKFADKWNIPSLKALTLSKLHRILVSTHRHLTNVNMAVATVDAIVALICYTYEDEKTPGLAGGDELRELVESFLACHDEALLLVPKFVEFLNKGGILEGVFNKIMRGRRVDRAETGYGRRYPVIGYEKRHTGDAFDGDNNMYRRCNTPEDYAEYEDGL